MGTVHLNKDNRLCLGPFREGAPALRLQRGRPQGEQVRLHTAGTEYDENINDRPKKEVSAQSSSVAGLTFVGIRSDDEDELEEEVEGYGVVNVMSITEANAARVEKPEVKEKWSNPTKILKKKAENEKKYAVGKSLRSGTWVPATVTDITEEVGTTEDMEVEEDDAPVGPVNVESVKKPRVTRAPLVQRRKFMDYLKETSSTESLLNEIMDQCVSVRLRDIMTSSESLMKLMFKGIPKKDEDVVIAKVGNMSVRRAERTYAAATPKARVKIGNIYVDAMLDSGAEVNVMTRSLADKAGLTVRTNLMLVLKTVLGDMRKFNGACEDVNISIGGITNVQTVMVIEDIDHKLILGCPFFHDAQLTFTYDDEGYQCARFVNEDRTKVGVTRVCSPQGKAWREARASPEASENE